MSDGDTFQALRERFAELGARAAAVYGFSPLLGRLYYLLFVSPDPMTLDQLAAASGAARSTTSVAMRQLEHYRVVQRDWRKGDRRDFYRARVDYAGILRDWYRLFAQQELAYMAQGSADIRRALAGAPEGGDWPDAEQRNLLLERLDRMDGAVDLFRIWLGGFLEAAEPGEPPPAEVIPIEVAP